jgi:ketosteroid isomerase-like protein
MSDTVTAEVEDLLKQWSQAYQAKDIDRLLGFAIGDDVQLVGTGADEVRFGLDEYRAQAERDLTQAEEASMTFSNLRVVSVGDTAFAYCDVRVAGSAGGQAFDMSGLRATFGLVRTGDGWRIVQSHLSTPDSAQPEGSSFEG